ncbi:MAG: RiPP maturation radical SAM C-methyltransferase [Thermogutta sp.]
MSDAREIVLINMPFAHLRWPNLGLSLLAAAVKKRSLPCRTLYLNFSLAEEIGYDTYEWIADHYAFILGGDRLFTEAYFGKLPTDHQSYYDEVLLPVDPHLGLQEYQQYLDIFQKIRPFLDKAFAAYPWEQAAVIGFATTFQQTLASLALARRIKETFPDAVVVFGGAACEDGMGVELIHRFPQIDYVFLGEADETFPELAAAIRENRTPPVLPGVLARNDFVDPRPIASDTPSLLPPANIEAQSATVQIGQSAVVTDLDCLPYPDFDDYFATLRSSPLHAELSPMLFFEMSRGCWWGEKHHCAFCGLNGQSLRFRSKSPQRVIEELRYLVTRYNVHQGCAADNILDFRYFRSLLPELEKAQLPFTFACELKTNLKRSQIEQLLRTGLRAAQLGIETFDSKILQGLNKGVRGYQNLQTLKWFAEARIAVEWNILYRFPWETPQTYENLTRLIEKIPHFPPPLGVGEARMDRFSPFFEHPEQYRMKNPRASRAFRHVFPFSQEVLNRLAYYYEFDADWEVPQEYVAPFLEAIERWQEGGPHGQLTMHWKSDDELIVFDTRNSTMREHRLRGLEAQLYILGDAAQPLQTLAAFASHHSLKMEALNGLLQQWIKDNLMIHWDDRFLSLALWTPEQSSLYRATQNHLRAISNV